MQSFIERKYHRVGWQVEIPRRQSEIRHSLQLLRERTNSKVLPMCKCHLSNRRTVQWNSDAKAGRNTLRSDTNIWNGNCSRLKSKWPTPTESCLQLSVPKNLQIPMVWKCNGSTALSRKADMGGTSRKTNKQFQKQNCSVPSWLACLYISLTWTNLHVILT